MLKQEFAAVSTHNQQLQLKMQQIQNDGFGNFVSSAEESQLGAQEEEERVRLSQERQRIDADIALLSARTEALPAEEQHILEMQQQQLLQTTNAEQVASPSAAQAEMQAQRLETWQTHGSSEGHIKEEVNLLQERLQEMKEELRKQSEGFEAERMRWAEAEKLKLTESSQALKKESEKTRQHLLEQINAKQEECEKIQLECNNAKVQPILSQRAVPGFPCVVVFMNRSARSVHLTRCLTPSCRLTWPAFLQEQLNELQEKLHATEQQDGFGNFVAADGDAALLDNRVTEERTRADDAEQRAAESQRELEDLRTRYAAEEEQRRNAGDQSGRVRELEEKCVQLNDRLAEEENAQQDLKARLQQVKEQLAREKETHEEAIAQEKNQHTEAAASLKSEYSKAMQKCKQQMDSLKSEKEHAEENLQHKQEELEAVQVQVQELQHKKEEQEAMHQELQAQLQAAQAQAAQAKEAQALSAADLESKDEQIRKLATEVQQKDEQIEKLQTGKKNIKELIQKIKVDTQEKDRALEKNEKEIRSLEHKNQRLKKELKVCLRMCVRMCRVLMLEIAAFSYNHAR